MKKVRNVIVTIATTSEMMLFVIEIAVPVSPSTFDAPPFETASRILSTMWYFVCRKPSRPRPFVRSSTYPGSAWTKSFTWLTSVGMKRKPSPTIAPIART